MQKHPVYHQILHYYPHLYYLQGRKSGMNGWKDEITIPCFLSPLLSPAFDIKTLAKYPNTYIMLEILSVILIRN